MPRTIDLLRLKELMAQEEIDLLVASSPANVFYSTDLPCFYTARNRLLYVVKDNSPSFCVFSEGRDPTLIVTASAMELARRHSWVKDVRAYATGTYIWRPEERAFPLFRTDPFECLSAVIKERMEKGARIGLELSKLSQTSYQRLQVLLEGYELVDGSKVFEEMRMIKGDEEIRRFLCATKALCRALEEAFNNIEQGITELDLLEIILERMKKEGAEAWHQTTVAFGPEHGPDIFNQASERKVKPGDLIRIDVGCVYQGYCADLSRTYAYKESPQEARELYSVLKQAQELMLEKAKPGVKASELHSIAVNHVRKHLDPHYSRGNVGHGVGVELYDAPQLSESDHRPLQRGMTLSFEVPYHKYGLGGFNIEDSVLVKEMECEVISELPRELLVAK